MIKDICNKLRRAASAQGSGAVKQLAAFCHEEQGATMVEYGLMVALIAIVCIGAVTTIGTNLNLVFTDIAGSI